MEFLQLEASDYESALKQARSEYGNAVRIHTRKDYSKGSLLSKQKRCRITYYLVQTKPQVVEPPSEAEEVFDAEACLDELLSCNDVPLSLHARAKQQLFKDKPNPSRAEIEIQVLQLLFEGVQFEDEIPNRYAVFVGAAGVGKTTALVKTAIFLRAQKGRKVALLSLDTHRVGSLAQIRQIARGYALPLFEASGEKALQSQLAELASFDHVLVDTCTFGPKDAEKKQAQDDLLDLVHHMPCSTYLVVSASFKERDLLDQQQRFSSHPLQATICTKLDETSGIGNLLGFVRRSNLPLLFLSDGQSLSEEYQMASASSLMTQLKGFNLDLAQFFPNT